MGDNGDERGRKHGLVRVVSWNETQSECSAQWAAVDFLACDAESRAALWR